MQNTLSMTKFILGTTLSSTLLMASGSASAKEYYKWVDSKGSTHYTATPPPKNAKKSGTVDTYGYRGSSTAVTTPNANSTTTVPTTSTPQQLNQQPTPVTPNENTPDRESQINPAIKETVRHADLPS